MQGSLPLLCIQWTYNFSLVIVILYYGYSVWHLSNYNADHALLNPFIELDSIIISKTMVNVCIDFKPTAAAFAYVSTLYLPHWWLEYIRKVDFFWFQIGEFLL